METKLSVNINKFALVRNSRGYMPDIAQIATDIEKYGADGITIHPRPDQRHITRNDVYLLKNIVTTEFNIEGYPSKEFLDMVCEVKPTQCTLVPDHPSQLTSDHGWDLHEHKSLLAETIAQLKENNIRVSLFIDTNIKSIENLIEVDTDRVEIYTGPYAQNPTKEILNIKETAHAIKKLGIGLNAGHDLNIQNLKLLKQNCPELLEVSIGHALVCDAWYFGLENTIQMYKRTLEYNVES